MSTKPKKDTIYIEADDDITTVIDKLQRSAAPVVALVLPKRANVFHSVVNLKLLKRAAAKVRKQPVLVTSSSAIIKLASVTEMYVAKTLQSKPEIPESAEANTKNEDKPAEVAEPDEPKLATVAAAGAVATEDAIELDNTVAKPAEAIPAANGKKAKKFIKIPDFGSFRTRLFIGIFALLLLIVGGIFALFVLPKANVKITTDSKAHEVKLSFMASASAKEPDFTANILPAGEAEIAKTDTEKVPATGEKNLGTKADGTMVVFNCNKDDKTLTVDAGTVFSAGGFNFVSGEAFSIAASNFTGGGICKKDKSVSITVTASEMGTRYNIPARSYSTSSSDITGSGSDMTGGTDNIVKVVSATDIENGKQRLLGRSKAAALDELKAKLNGLSLMPLEQTFGESAPKVESSVQVDTEAADVTVTVTTVYKLLGVKQDQLKQLVEDDIKQAITNDKQKIQDNGLAAAQYLVVEKPSDGEQKLELRTISTIGPDINITEIAKQIAGKKRGEIDEIVRQINGVKDVTVTYSPFWVLKTPSNPKKIHITLEQQH